MSERKSKDKNNGKKEKDSLKEELGFTEDSIMDEDEVVDVVGRALPADRLRALGAL